MSEGVDHAGGAADTDTTVVLPAPGGPRGNYRFAPPLERQAAAADLAALGGFNPLIEAANPLLSAVPLIRQALRHPDSAGLRARLLTQLDAFEAAARAAGLAEDRRFVARYVLCAVLDDAAAATPWGRDWGARRLAAELHADTGGADRFFALLDATLAQPAAYGELLELFYVCLALGFEGRYRGGEGGRLALAQIRARLHAAIAARRPQGLAELSARWRGEDTRPRRRSWFLRPLDMWRGRGLRVANDRLLDALGVPEEVLLLLRRARFPAQDGSRRTLLELPWYALLGSPGSGKASAVTHAGLRFPLGDAQPVRNVGVPGRCDWWFTDEAVLLDIARRLDSDARDADGDDWRAFLGLLKQHRPVRPLNGVIVAVSTYDLVHWSAEESALYARHVRGTLSGLQAELGMRMPVYVLVTKADLLAGFGEFFSELDAEQRTQVWGVTLARSEVLRDGHHLARRVDEELELIERRLYAMMPARLHEERDLQRRGAIYRFPQQFHGARPLIAGFLDAAFGGSAAGELPLVRGIYLSSATQAGSPIDRVLATLSRAFNLERKVQPPNVDVGKSYFLRRLFREVIFGEERLAGADGS